MEPFNPKDPAIAAYTIYVGHLKDIVTNELLQTQFSKHGHIVGFSRTSQGFCFIKYDNTTSTSNAITSEDKTSLNGVQIMVKGAGQKGPNKVTAEVKNVQQEVNTESSPEAATAIPMDTSELLLDDCVIVVTSAELNNYAEEIEEKLKKLGVRVHRLVPDHQVLINVVLGTLQQQGYLYAIILNPVHLHKNSLTLIILYGEGVEHKDMPKHDALNFMYNDFCIKTGKDIEKVKLFQRRGDFEEGVSDDKSRANILDLDTMNTRTSDSNESFPKKDCIILTKLDYKESIAPIAAFLKASGMSVGFMVHENHVPMETSVEAIHNAGHRFCILLLPEHIERESLTLFIFQDKPEVHMNIKRIEALSFLKKVFALTNTNTERLDLSRVDRGKMQVQILRALEDFEKTCQG